MRIDELDLFGPLLINGSTGSEGQVFGFSGSDLTWITATSSGTGSPGPQGPVGTGIYIPTDEIAFGCVGGGGVTSSSLLKICNNTNFVHGTPTITGGYYDTVIGSGGGGGTTQITDNYGYCRNTIIGGRQIITQNNLFSVAAGGYNNQMQNSRHSTVLGGFENCVSRSTGLIERNSVISGRSNRIDGGSTLCLLCGNSIIGGYNSYMSNGNTSVYHSSIVGSYTSFINVSYSTYYSTFAKYSSIIGGRFNSIGNYLLEYSNNNVILGGNNNKMKETTNVIGGGHHGLDNSVIVASNNSIMATNNGVMIGVDSRTMDLRNDTSLVSGPRSNNVMIGCGRVANYSMFCTYTNTNAYFCDGTFFNRINGKGNCFVVYCGISGIDNGKMLKICF